MSGRFEGKVVLITGAGTGIGKAIALSFADEGAFCYLASRREDRLVETLEGIRTGGGEGRVVVADLTDSKEIERLISSIRSGHGHLDILVNAAGNLGVGLVHEMTEEQYDRIFDLNVKALWRVSVAALPLLRGRKNSNIINISSMAGSRTDTGLGLYEASKAAVNTLTKVMAKELASDRIRVNAIAPGPIDTQLYRGSVYGDHLEDALAKAPPTQVPFGRVGTPVEVARLTLFLASPESDFISGSITSIDGAVGY